MNISIHVPFPVLHIHNWVSRNLDCKYKPHIARKGNSHSKCSRMTKGALCCRVKRTVHQKHRTKGCKLVLERRQEQRRCQLHPQENENISLSNFKRERVFYLKVHQLKLFVQEIENKSSITSPFIVSCSPSSQWTLDLN